MPAPFRLPPLDPTRHDALQACYNTTGDPEIRTRCQMVLLASEQHLTSAAIAPTVRRSHDSVLRVLRHFATDGLAALPRRYCRTGNPLLTPAWQAELRRVIDLDPHRVGVESANWTTDLLADYLAQTTGITVDHETVRQWLHRFGYVCKRPTWTLIHKAQEREDWLEFGCASPACGWKCS